MGLYNFKKRFVPFIESGEKTHTIREKRKYPSKAGETLYLYEGLRTKKARKILEAECLCVEPITVKRLIRGGRMGRAVCYAVIIGEQSLSQDEIEAFAQSDGFQNFAELIDFWKAEKRQFPWSGDVIHWRKP